MAKKTETGTVATSRTARFPMRELLTRALTEVLGSDASVVSDALIEPARLPAELEARYGPTAGRGLAQRVGGAFAASMSVHLLNWLSETHPGFRLMPMRARLRSGLEGLPNFLPYPVDRVVVSDEVDGRLTLSLGVSSAGTLSAAPESICDFLLGILKETLASLGGGRSFQVDEVSKSERGQGRWIFSVVLDPVE